MADEPRLEQLFDSWSDSRRFAHPDSPAGGSGPGCSRPPGPLGSSSSAWHPNSPASRYLASSTNLTLDLSTIWRIVYANSWETLAQPLLHALDAGSFELGFFYGVAEGGLGVIEGLLDLVKMIVLEGIYEKIHSESWWWHPEDKALDLVLHSHLENAHRESQQLMDELREVVSHPLVFFGNVWDAEVEEYSQKWQRFNELMKKPSIANSFAAGRIAGQTALEVLLLLATVIDGAGLALKGAKELRDLPELLKLAKRVSGKDAKNMLKRLRTGHGTLGEPKPPKLEKSPPPPPKDDVPREAPKIPKKPSYVWGQSDGGPGKWGPPSTPRNQLGAPYQQEVTGAPPGTEYKVPLATRKSGFVDFDGYDPQRNVLVDAKDFNDWPVQEPEFLRQKAIGQLTQEAQDQLAAAKGTPIEWHVPTEAKAEEIQDILDKEGYDAIRVVVTPKP